MSNKAVLCPVCSGVGKVEDCIIDSTASTTVRMKLCYGCNGKGWVEVSDSSLAPADLYPCCPNFPYVPYYPKEYYYITPWSTTTSADTGGIQCTNQK